MKKGWLILLLSLLTIPVIGQVSFGVRAGGSYSSLSQKVGDKYESGNRMGYNIGGLMDIRLYKRWSLRPELSFVFQGGSYFSGMDVDGMSMHNKYKYHSLQVPVNLTYTFTFTDVKLSIFAGPVADFSLYGKMKTEDIYTDIHFGDTEEKDLKPFDLGVSFGVSAEYKKYFFAIHTVSGTLDRRATKRDGESSVFQNNVTFSLGYLFRR